MDLKYTDATPSDAERAAVDALLGPPPSGWEGAAERSDEDLRWARGGAAAARDRRDQLLPGDGGGVVGMKNGQKRVVDNYPVYMVACTCALTSKKWGRKIHLATASFIFIP